MDFQRYSYKDLVANIEELKKHYPFIHLEVIGHSVMGKNIVAIRLGVGAKELFYSGDWHANEYLTAPLLMTFVEDFAKAYANHNTLRGIDVQKIYQNTSIWIVPMVNPDGIELVQEGINPDHPFYETVLKINEGFQHFDGWSANINGVDLNHQWPADWEEEAAVSPQKPSPRKYGGERPLSEPETQAIYSFTKRHNFRMVLAFHSQGEVIYWGYKGFETKDSEHIVNQFSTITGYIPERVADSSAGYKDWFVQEYVRPGFTVEVGYGTNPLPFSQFKQIYSTNLELLLKAPLFI